MSYGNNAPYNVPALEALVGLRGANNVSLETARMVLGAPPENDLSGLRGIAARLQPYDYWKDTVDLTQPKRQVGDCVEQHGTPVPPRFETLEDTLDMVQAGGPSIVRSEDPDEYDGPSGLMDSHIVTQAHLDGTISAPPGSLAKFLRDGEPPEDALWRAQDFSLKKPNVVQYLDVTDGKRDAMRARSSFSFWALVAGRNITIVADDSIPDRYHLFSVGVDAEGQHDWAGSGYVARPDGTTELRSEQQGKLDELEIRYAIESYETVRSYPELQGDNCDVQERQLGVDGTMYFLQNHKGRPFRERPASLRLDAADYPAQEGWRPANAVRGALGECVTLNTAVEYPYDYASSRHGRQLPEWEDASFDMVGGDGLMKALVPRRTASLRIEGHPGTFYGDMASGHSSRSAWFTPMAALAIAPEDYRTLVTPDIYSVIFTAKRQRSAMTARLTLDVASDGERGYVRLNPDVEQPLMVHDR